MWAVAGCRITTHLLWVVASQGMLLPAQRLKALLQGPRALLALVPDVLLMSPLVLV